MNWVANAIQWKGNREAVHIIVLPSA